MDLNVGEGGNDLLLGWELWALLELEVTDCAGQGKVAVDAAEINEATGSLDPCLLGCRMLAESPAIGRGTHPRSGVCGQRRAVLLGLLCLGRCGNRLNSPTTVSRTAPRVDGQTYHPDLVL